MKSKSALANGSIAEIPEGELIERLMSDTYWRSRLLGINGIPESAKEFLEVDLQGLAMGDIDILLVESDHPDFATVIQVKRIKVKEDTFKTRQPNKLNEIDKLKKQTNTLVEIGFAQVFCFVIVVVDSRGQNQGRYGYEGLTRELRTKVDNAICLAGLAEQAGFVHFEIVQPMDYPALSVSAGSTKLKRMPTITVQPERVTNWVANVIQSKS